MATYGKYTGYEPVPDIPGAYSFQVDGGKPVLAGGQAALDLKARLDAANAATMTAGKDAAGGFSVPEFAPKAPGTRDWAAEFAAAPSSKAAPTAEPPKPTGPQPHMVNGINTGIEIDPDGTAWKHVAGSAGKSKEQYEAQKGQGTALPTAESETTVGGFEQDPEYLAARNANAEKARGAINEQRDAEITATEAGRAVAGQQFVAQTAALNTQKYLTDLTEAEVANAQARRDQAVKDYTGTKIDPSRVFSGGAGFAKRLGAALAAGFGAYGAAINRTENFAGKIVDNMIERDIRAQEVDLQTKKGASDSALADLTRRGMSLEQAKGTLATIMGDWKRQQLELAKGQSGSDVINAKYDAYLAKIDNDELENKRAYDAEARGKVTKAIQSSVMYPQAATAGGRRRLSPEESMRLAGQTASTDSTVVGNKKTLAELQGGGKPESLEGTKSDKISALTDGIQANQELLNVLPEGESNYDDPASGFIDELTDKSRFEKINELTQRGAKGAQASRGKSDVDAELAMKDQAGNKSLSARKRLANQQLQIQTDNLRQELSGMTPQQRAAAVAGMPENVRKVLIGE